MSTFCYCRIFSAGNWLLLEWALVLSIIGFMGGFSMKLDLDLTYLYISVCGVVSLFFDTCGTISVFYSI